MAELSFCNEWVAFCGEGVLDGEGGFLEEGEAGEVRVGG